MRVKAWSIRLSHGDARAQQKNLKKSPIERMNEIMKRLWLGVCFFVLAATLSGGRTFASPRTLECQEVSPSGVVVSEVEVQDGSRWLLSSGTQASLSLDRQGATLSLELTGGSLLSVSRPGRFRRHSFLQVQLPDASFIRCMRAS